jgi:ABC-type Mn2+/Zn2+ transport system permease subunit
MRLDRKPRRRHQTVAGQKCDLEIGQRHLLENFGGAFRFGVISIGHLGQEGGGGATLLLGAFLIWRLQTGSTITTEVAIGVIFTAALAIGTVVTPSEDLIEALFGGFQSLTLTWFLMGIFAVASVIAFIWTFRHQLIIGLFSPDLAAATGVYVSASICIIF